MKKRNRPGHAESRLSPDFSLLKHFFTCNGVARTFKDDDCPPVGKLWLPADFNGFVRFAL